MPYELILIYRFPSVFRYLREHQPNSKYYESDLFPADTTSADDDDYDSGSVIMVSTCIL